VRSSRANSGTKARSIPLRVCVSSMVKKGPSQPPRASSGGGGDASDEDADASAPTHAQLAEALARAGSPDAMVQNEALVSLHIFISTVYTQGGSASLPHPDILQAVVPLLSNAALALPAHVVVAQILRTVADNAGEDVCDVLAASSAVPSVVANLGRALAAPSADICALCSDYFFFLASLCDCRHPRPPPPLPTPASILSILRLLACSAPTLRPSQARLPSCSRCSPPSAPQPLCTPLTLLSLKHHCGCSFVCESLLPPPPRPLAACACHAALTHV
jgi:hypothetical protein